MHINWTIVQKNLQKITYANSDFNFTTRNKCPINLLTQGLILIRARHDSNLKTKASSKETFLHKTTVKKAPIDSQIP